VSGYDLVECATEERRTHWLMMSSMPAVARHAYLLAQAYNEAFEKGESWVM
jgi:hypothetical protein